LERLQFDVDFSATHLHRAKADRDFPGLELGTGGARETLDDHLLGAIALALEMQNVASIGTQPETGRWDLDHRLPVDEHPNRFRLGVDSHRLPRRTARESPAH
jgi:hypothetical protein